MSTRSRPRSNDGSPRTPRPPRTDGGSTATGSSSPLIELLAVFVLVYVLQGIVALASVGLMTGLFVLTPPVLDNPWTIITSVYAHAGLGHLFSNSVALVVFGWPVARATTRLRFHAFFLVTGALAGITQVALPGIAAAIPLVPGGTPPGVLGASGAVFALLGYLIASNRLSAGLASFVEVPRWLAVLVFVGLAIAVTIATASPSAALIAHFTGFLLGLIAGRVRVLNVNSPAGTNRPPV